MYCLHTAMCTPMSTLYAPDVPLYAPYIHPCRPPMCPYLSPCITYRVPTQPGKPWKMTVHMEES